MQGISLIYRGGGKDLVCLFAIDTTGEFGKGTLMLVVVYDGSSGCVCFLIVGVFV